MDIENMVVVIDEMLSTKRKRHIVGGILISASFLFGGLAITVLTLKENKDE